MEMLLKIHFGCSRAAEADARDMLQWVGENWADRLSDFRLDESTGSQRLTSLRIKCSNRKPLEDILSHLLDNYIPRDDFQVTLTIRVR